MKREELRNKLTDILSAAMSGGINLTQAERSIWDLFNPGLPPAEGAKKVQWSGYGELGNISQKPLQPTAEGAEEIIDSIVESLGDPINIHNHAFEIRPYTVEHKTEWWIFHKEAGPGEPLKQWLSKFATLHAQQMADKMVEEKLREELIAYVKWYGSFSYENLTDEMLVDEYLKSREK